MASRRFRRLRPLSLRLIWAATALTAVVIAVAAWLGAPRLLAVVVLAVPAGLLVLRALPPQAVRRVLTSTEVGCTDRTATGSRSWRWSDVTSVEGLVLSVDGERVDLAGLEPSDGLVLELGRRLRGRVPLADTVAAAESVPRRRTATVALVLPVLLPLVATLASAPKRDRTTQPVAALPSDTPAPRTTAPRTTPARQRPDVPYTMGEFSDVCTGVGYIGVTAYPGPAPRYVYVAGGLTAPSEWQTETVHLVQLVACVEESQGNPVRTCPYSGSGGTPVTRTVTEGIVTLTLRAARTGNVVATVRLVGEDADQCPPMLYNRGADHAVSTEVTEGQVRRALAQYVTG
jgi:hypothetical protein